MRQSPQVSRPGEALEGGSRRAGFGHVEEGRGATGQVEGAVSKDEGNQGLSGGNGSVGWAAAAITPVHPDS